MIEYEWSVEEVDEYGDIQESDFSGKLSYFKPSEITARSNLVLVRSEGTESEGVLDKHWAYVKDGQLPEHFESSQIPIPKRFIAELSRWESCQ